MILYEKREKENSKDYAYRVLKDNIMVLNLKPGELLSEAELSEKLGISRTPIREVLMRLKNEHLIEVKPPALYKSIPFQ
ncbi:MAG: GntR family transcriptional regulator [Romboutsia sp.]